LTYQPSQLSLGSGNLVVQLRFVPPSYELLLVDEVKKTNRRAVFTGGDLRQVTLDMHPVEAGNIKLSYVARHILIEVSGKIFARVLDVDFMRLHNAASVGMGESISTGDAFDLR
jgi:hypothetical protein